jgi:predicted O-linked N-acetylglucosamine transferase (SPINDLY family)
MAALFFKPIITSVMIHSMFNEGFELHKKGRLREAKEKYQKVLLDNPKHFDALHLLGVIENQTNNCQQAVDLIEKAITIDPQSAPAFNNLGNALCGLKKYEKAVKCYETAVLLKVDYAQAYNNMGNAQSALNQFQLANISYEKAITLKPDYTEALSNWGVALKELKQYEAALQKFNKALEVNPNYADAYNNQGAALSDLKRYEEAIKSYERALEIKPDNAQVYNNQGVALNAIKQHLDAIESYKKAIAIQKSYPDAYSNLGVALNDLKQHQAAVEKYNVAIAIKPEFALAYCNRGVALNEMKQYRQAIESYNEAIRLQPDYADAYCNRGVSLNHIKQHAEAMDSYSKAITLKKDYPEAFLNLGTVLNEIKRHKDAIICYKKAIALRPNYAEAYNNLGNAYKDLKDYEKVIDSYSRALELNPESPFLTGLLVHTKMQICDWGELQSQIAKLLIKIEESKLVTAAFPVLSLTASLSLQRKAAELSLNKEHPENLALGSIPRRMKSEKILVAYFSADFKNHAVSILTAELFETHNRDRFEIYAFSFGVNTKDPMRLRIEKAFDKFIDVQFHSDEEIAKLSRNIGIDIAVDLGGLTNETRPGIFALRAAPIQVNFIGYPGTMGAPYMDYIIADKHVVPEDIKANYAEKVVYLPCFQPNDSKRKISDKFFTRQELGLPETGFIFCSFSNNYKINPSIFSSWMRILQKVNNSRLLLLAESEKVYANLRKEALQRQIDPDRLIFGQRIAQDEYLARYRTADLFLDTYPFNGGTTVSDALWAGLPVLTWAGEAFASRMASSLLHAIGLPELITSTQEGYEAMAVALASNPERLKNIRLNLQQNRHSSILFNTQMFARNIEKAYTQMYEKQQDNSPPEHIDVTAPIFFETTQSLK